MATQEQTALLLKTIALCLTYNDEALINRPDLGALDFNGAKHDLDRIFGIVKYLETLPIDQLADSTVNEIKAKLEQITSCLQQIRNFSLGQQNPVQIRSNLVAQIHGLADALYISAGPWIAFLAYQSGNVQKSIELLTSSVNESQRITEMSRQNFEAKNDEIDNIITQAREASASSGAAVFTSAFLGEAVDQNRAATRWLVAAAFFAIVTLGAAVLMWARPEAGLSSGELTQKLGTKIAILVVLFTVTMWCGRIYKALRHQASVNKHRGLSLQTFQAFTSAAADVNTKNAVLMEATRAIFTVGTTGFLDGKSGKDDSSTRMIEIVQNPSPASITRAVTGGID